MESKSFNWDAADFFRRLTESNKLARSKNFKFCLVSSLEGFEEALARMQSSTAFVCVSDVSSGVKAAVTPWDWAGMVLLCFVLPAVLSVLFCEIERRLGWIKEGDLKLD